MRWPHTIFQGASRRARRVSLGFLVFVLFLPLPIAAQTVVGILPFTNDTGDPAADRAAQGATHTLQKRLHVETGTMPRLLATPAATSTDAPDTGVASAAFLRAKGVTHLVRGSVRAVPSSDPGEAAGSFVLSAEVIAASTGQPVTVEAEGSAGPDALDTAIAALAASILDAIASGSEAGETESEGGEVSTESQDVEEEPEPPAPDVEELQQLLSEAESFSGTAGQRNAVQAAVAQLLAALEGRAALMEQEETASEDSESEAESDIAGGQDRLEEALETGREDGAAVESGPAESQSSFSVETITTLLDSTLQIIQRIQEMRSAERGIQEEESFAEETEDGEETRAPQEAGAREPEVEEDAREEELEDVTGAVTENGVPVEGAVVTEPDLGISATTGPDGAYALRGVPARWTSLQVSREGRVLARGNVDVVPGRRALADFDVQTAPGASARTTPMSRVLPSAVSVRSQGGPSGTVTGTVEDARGKALARAQVTLPGLAVARTDSKGRYVFRKVPVGTHELQVTHAGLAAAVRRVNVSPGSTTQAAVRCGEASPRPDGRGTLRDPGAGTRLSGTVTDDSGRPIAGARVLATSAGRSLSVSTRGDGGYALRALKVGSYRVVATKVGYRDVAKAVAVATRSEARQDFRLRRATSQSLQKVAAKSRGHEELKGRVVGADQRGVAGARISLQKAGRAASVSSLTSKDGSYRIRASPGAYRLRASKTGLGSASRDITVGAGASRVEDIVLRPSSKQEGASSLSGKSGAAASRKLLGDSTGTGSKAGAAKRWLVYGRVTDESTGRPVNGASVSLSDTRYAMAPNRTTRSDGDGSFAFEIETQGAFRLRAVKSGFLTEEKPVHVGNSSRVSADLRLRAKQSTVSRSVSPAIPKSKGIPADSIPPSTSKSKGQPAASNSPSTSKSKSQSAASNSPATSKSKGQSAASNSPTTPKTKTPSTHSPQRKPTPKKGGSQ